VVLVPTVRLSMRAVPSSPTSRSVMRSGFSPWATVLKSSLSENFACGIGRSCESRRLTTRVPTGSDGSSTVPSGGAW
jgi:hypothetical protein